MQEHLENPPPENTNGNSAEATASREDRPCWPRLHPLDLAAIAVTLGIAVAVTVPRLSSGICFGDSGGIQLAAATSGITHPPGYVGYLSLAHLFTLVPGVDPAYMVSLACLGCGVITLLLCIMIQVRLGVGVGLACAASLGLTAYARFWTNLLAPEVYIPTLMFMTTSAYLLIRYSRRGVRRDLYLAALLFGSALANRPPALFTLPFFLAVWWLASRKLVCSSGLSLKPLLVVLGCGILPGVHSLAYLWVRDNPSTRYNYIAQFTAETQELPLATDGPRAKVERISWLITGRQFRALMGNTWSGVRAKFRFLRNELLPLGWLPMLLIPYQAVIFLFGLVILALAGVIAWQRCRITTLLLLGLACGSTLFVCLYRIHGDAADYLPLLFLLTVLVGVALSPLLPFAASKRQRTAALVLAGAACAGTVLHAPYRHKTGANLDAARFLKQLDMPTLPRNAVICSHWGTSPPLWYAQWVLFDRDDLHVVNAWSREWLRMTEPMRGRPLYATSQPNKEDGFTFQRYRNVWRLERIENPPESESLASD